MADSKILNNDSDFSDDSDYDSNDEGYVDLVRTGPSAIHGSKTKPYETGVSLGFIDCEEEADSSPFDSRLGGQPLWMSARGREVPTCGNCKRQLALLVQLYAPLEGTEYDRCLYVFICKQAGCKRAKGSVRALRGVKRDLAAERKAATERKQKEKEEEEKKKMAEQASKSVGADLFGSGLATESAAAAANPFGGSSNPFAAASNPFAATSNPFAAAVESKPKAAPASSSPTFADVVKQTIPEKPKEVVVPAAKSKAADPADAQTFADGYYLYVETEVLDPLFNKRSLPAGLNPQDLLNLKLDTTPDDADTEAGSVDARAAEMAGQIPGADDPIFQKFVDTVSQHPTQIVRYDRQGGTALLYSSRDDVAKTLASKSIPVHPVTREPRQVELQIMPHAITVLEEDELKRAGTEAADVKKQIENGMEWGTIFVATPLVDDLELDEDGVGYSEEWVGVQYEQF